MSKSYIQILKQANKFLVCFTTSFTILYYCLLPECKNKYIISKLQITRGKWNIIVYDFLVICDPLPQVTKGNVLALPPLYYVTNQGMELPHYTSPKPPRFNCCLTQAIILHTSKTYLNIQMGSREIKENDL